MRKTVKILSVVLSIVMMTTALPLSAFAGIFTPVIPVCTEHIGTATCVSLAICENCGITFGDYAEHTYSNLADSTCNGCGFEREVLESPEITLHVFDNGCDTTCNECDYTRAPHHKGGNATCITLAVCIECGESYGEFNPKKHVGETELRGDFLPSCNTPGFSGNIHCSDCGVMLEEGSEIDATGNHVDSDEKWEFNENEHFHTCDCGTVFNNAAHVGGSATCTTQAVCTECGASYGKLLDHTYDNACDTTCNECGGTREVPGHVGGTATCTTQAVCTECGVSYGNLAEHTYDNACDTTCNECGGTREVPGHVGGTATCTTQAVCTECGASYGDLAGHIYDTACDATCNACGGTREVPGHVGGTATCDKQAVCTVCNELYGATLPHTYSGLSDKTCDVCGQEREINESPVICLHRYTNENDPICNLCGRVRVVEVDENLYFKSAALVLESNLTVKYRVDKQRLSDLGYTDPYVIFNFHGEDSEPVYPSVEQDEEDYYVFLFTDVAANMIGDTISATLHASNGGKELKGEVQDYSAAEYCYNQLEKETSSASLKKLLVDLLNYGSQAQLYTGYNTDSLANQYLTEEQKAFATQKDPELESHTNLAKEKEEIYWNSASLILDNSVNVRVKFTAASIEDLVIKVNADGYEWTFDSEHFIHVDGETYYLYFDCLNADQMRKLITVSAYLNGAEQDEADAVLEYSIESYAYSKQTSTIDHLADLVKAMMKYGDSVMNWWRVPNE